MSNPVRIHFSPPTPVLTPVQNFTDFESMSLKPEVLECIHSVGIQVPFPVQQKAIVPLISSRDVFVQAPPYAGKTDSYFIASLQIVDPQLPHPQVLIVTVTREVATQLRDVCFALFIHSVSLIRSLHNSLSFLS